MKLLVLGADNEYAIERFYLRHWKSSKSEFEIDFLAIQNIFYKYYNKNYFNKFLFKIGLSSIYKIINFKLIDKINSFKPNIIFVFKGMEIFPSTLEYAKNKNIILVNYNPDNPFIFSGSGSGNLNITKSICLYDLHFTYNQEVKRQIEKAYKTRSIILPFGFDIPDELFEICMELNEIPKTCFIGTPDIQRAKFLNELAFLGISIDVYGNNWESFRKSKNITCYKSVKGDEFWKTLRKYRIQLNLMRTHNLNSHNMRSFEIPSIGGIQLAPNTYDHKNYFEEGKEIFLFKNLDDCFSKINYLLSLNYDESRNFRILARQASINKEYSYKHRAIEVLKVINALPK